MTTLNQSGRSSVSESAAWAPLRYVPSQAGVAQVDSASAGQATAQDRDLASMRNRAGLTRREADVVSLLTHGLTNREIAATLVVTEGTAENYVHRVLTRLGFNNRVQVAAWAVQRGLGRAA